MAAWGPPPCWQLDLGMLHLSTLPHAGTDTSRACTAASKVGPQIRCQGTAESQASGQGLIFFVFLDSVSCPRHCPHFFPLSSASCFGFCLPNSASEWHSFIPSPPSLTLKLALRLWRVFMTGNRLTGGGGSPLPASRPSPALHSVGGKGCLGPRPECTGQAGTGRPQHTARHSNQASCHLVSTDLRHYIQI